MLAGCSTSAEPKADAANSRAAPRDAYVLLSGGGSPLSNNYSQYVQARALAGYLRGACPPDGVWIFFGAGNRPDVPPALADVRRATRRDGLMLPAWEPGVLAGNRPATRESFLRALRDEILPRVRDGGTLHLFVGDHGELAGKDEARESAITLWQLKPGRRGNWRTDEREILGVAELRRVLAEGLGRGRVVFAMTQCHSGGFHELGVAREPAPPRTWFARVPSWLEGRRTQPRLPIAGFTATDEDSPAAGCEPDPDPLRWAGYERFYPEAVLGRDLLGGVAPGPAAPTYLAAHEAATLVDRTIDKPRATSDHLLASWARVIETRLGGTLDVSAPILQAASAYQRAVDTGRLSVPAADPALREKQAQFARFTARLAEQLPAAKDLLLAGTRAQLDAAARGGGERPAGGGPRGGARRGQLAELRKVWSETLRPAWKTAVLGGAVPGLAGGALELEKHLLQLEDDGRELLLPRGGDDTVLVNEIYWRSGYAHPATLDRAQAEAAARWGMERRTRITAWGRASADPAVRAAAEKIGPAPALADEPPRRLLRQTAAERALYYRRVLAAWEFLLATDARDALAELRAVLELERTALPRE